MRLEEEVKRQIQEVESLRRAGILTPEQAYRRHEEILAKVGPSEVPAWPSESVPSALPQPELAEEPKPANVLDELRDDLFAISLAILGCLLAIVGVVFQEIQSGIGVFSAIIAAPLIEEVLKPTGVYITLARWPRLLRSQIHIAVLASLAGLLFGVIEGLVYVYVYFPDHPDWFVTYRFTLPLIMHATGSFLMGMGINRSLIDWANGVGALPRRSRNYFIAGIGLHAAFNTIATIIALSGGFDFD